MIFIPVQLSKGLVYYPQIMVIHHSYKEPLLLIFEIIM